MQAPGVVELPGCGARVTPTPDGLELYFPPLRAPRAALTLALFGAACLAGGLLAAAAFVPGSGSDSAGMLAFWLTSVFIMPLVVFGPVFLALALYSLANTLTVEISDSGIRSTRRVFGVPLGVRHIARSEISAIEPAAALGWHGLRDAEPRFRLVARARQTARRLTVAEGLCGEEQMEELKSRIVEAGRLGHLATPRAE